MVLDRLKQVAMHVHWNHSVPHILLIPLTAAEIERATTLVTNENTGSLHSMP